MANSSMLNRTRPQGANKPSSAVPLPNFQARPLFDIYQNTSSPNTAYNTSAPRYSHNLKTASASGGAKPVGGQHPGDISKPPAPFIPSPGGTGGPIYHGNRMIGAPQMPPQEVDPNTGQVLSPVDRAGQHAALRRYRPPMYDLEGRELHNDELGGYSYNLPNAFGPFPLYTFQGRFDPRDIAGFNRLPPTLVTFGGGQVYQALMNRLLSGPPGAMFSSPGQNRNIGSGFDPNAPGTPSPSPGQPGAPPPAPGGGGGSAPGTMPPVPFGVNPNGPSPAFTPNNLWFVLPKFSRG